MTADSDIRAVLAHYPGDCQPRRIESLGNAGGFSGSQFWRLATERGTLGLRRWPREHPTLDRLQFIQAVLWHVHQEGFRRAPLPLEAKTHAGFVTHDGSFWELTPWMPGVADYQRSPSPAKLAAAMTALAEFHVAAASFPLPVGALQAAPGIERRLAKLDALLSGGVERIRAATSESPWPQLPGVASAILRSFASAADDVRGTLVQSRTLRVALQPCIRDVWHDHVLFDGERVTALVDFGAMQADSVATDVARLLGSLVGDDPDGWRSGLLAYEGRRPLTDAEALLVTAYDRSTVLMGGLQWLEWILVERREFADRAAVMERITEFARRLDRLANR